MAGESGGELDASMLDVAMLDATPGTFALEVSAGNVATAEGAAELLLQMLHAQGELANELMQIAGEDRAIRFYNEYRALKPIMDEADAIVNDNRVVTI